VRLPSSNGALTSLSVLSPVVSYLQAIVIGLLQGVTELFPVSSLGHSVLVPAWLGWDTLLNGQSADESFFLAFVVGLHVATAAALVVYFRRDWAAIVGGLFISIRTRRVDTSTQRLGWLLVLATVPVGLVGLLFEHSLRTLFAEPLAAAIFLTINGLILAGGEGLRRRQRDRHELASQSLDKLPAGDAVLVGGSQIGALFAGISRSGITMVTGLLRGLDHEDAARFSFLLATPVIAAAGLYKLPDLFGPLGDGIRGQALIGSLCAAGAAYVSVRFLVRWFQTRTLTPFAIYCLIAGAISVVHFW
jgi:undecaprenyl-diphosphatase